MYCILFYIIGYRKNIVLQNLKYAFPKKSIKELKKIRKKFYRYFADFLTEQIKSFSISKKELQKRVQYGNIEILREVENLNKSCIILGAHYGNWEWLCSLQKYTSMECFGTYNKLSNPYFEKWIKKNRERFGAKLIITSNAIQRIAKNEIHNKKCIYGLLSDQSPVLEKSFYWRNFLNVEVPIHTGAEMLAKKYDFPILFMHMKRIKRSNYKITFEWLTKNAKDFKDYEITDIFLEKTMQMIQKDPSCYLWAHNRFKHKGKKHLCKNLAINK